MTHLPRKILLASACASALLLAHASASAPDPVADAAQKVDQDLQALKTDALGLSRELAATEQRVLYPEASRASFYVGVKVPGFLLDDISIRINETEPVRHSYTDSEARALVKGDNVKGNALHRLLRLKLEPGSYRLQAAWTGHFYDAKPDEPPVKGTVETVFEKGLNDIDMILPISRNSRLDRPGLSEVTRLESRKIRPNRNVWLPGPQQFDPIKADRGVLDDPRYRFATFLKEDGRYLSALTELLDIEQTAQDPEKLPPEFQLLIAGCYLDFGMEAAAQERYERIAAGPHDADTVARAQVQLARFEYQRGYFDRALARLDALKDPLPDEIADDRRFVQTSTLMAQGRYKEAIDILAARGDDLPAVLHYNLAAALMHEGRAEEAHKQLEIVGSSDVTDLPSLLLRDRANLSLGHQLLKAQRGADAKAAFVRIRATGPFSNQALLDLGWAEVAQTAKKAGEEASGKQSTDDSIGTMLRPGYVDPKTTSVKAGQPVTGLSSEEQQGLLRALVPWVELTKRDPMDPAVQEGFLAITWALDKLQDYTQSLRRYQEAISAFELARKRMDDAMRSIKGGRMVYTIVQRDPDAERGWTWKLKDLPDAPETYFLQTLLAEHRFQEMIKNYRDARMLTVRADAWLSRLETLEKTTVGEATLDRQLNHARKGWHPDWTGTVMWLNLETSLGAPGSYDGPIKIASSGPFELQTADAPENFTGRREQLRPLRLRLEALKPRAKEIGKNEDDLLEALSLHELEGQKKVIERYLTEARFAVARIYDKQQKGGR